MVIVLVFSRQIEARESKFFIKAINIHYLNTNATVSSQVEPPSPSPSEAPTPVESENGYGLYGQGATEFHNTFDNGESDIPTEKFKEESNKEYLNNNNGFPSSYNEHAHVTVPQGLSDTKFMENGKYVYDPKFAPTTTKTFGIPNQVPEENLYNNGYPNNYNENAYVTVPQDTTFMEDGKYYYDPKNERKYEAFKESSGNNNEGYYGNNNGEKSKYEFDSMEEYERQEGYPQTDQGEYVPWTIRRYMHIN